jgi:hypothetical protein
MKVQKPRRIFQMQKTMKFHKNAYKKAVEYVAGVSKGAYLESVAWTQASLPHKMWMEVKTVNNQGEAYETWNLVIAFDEKAKALVIEADLYDTGRVNQAAM